MNKLIYCIFTIMVICSVNTASLFAATINGQEYMPDEIIVKFKNDISERVKSRIMEKQGITNFKSSYKNRFKVLKVPENRLRSLLKILNQHPAVEYAEPNYILKAYFTPNDEFYNLQWNLPLINMEDAWEISTGEGVTVAVVDTGVNPNGNDSFGNRLLEGYNALLGVEHRWEDGNSHGTHVAGTIGQATNNSRGVAGIAFDAEILPVKALTRSGTGTLNATVDGIIWAADNGADIINMSLGGLNTADTLEDALAYAYGQGVTLIAASGNEAGPVGYPAAYDNVIAVGAVDYNKQLAPYSNFGPELDIAAPGGDILEDLNGDGYSDGILQETFRQYIGFRNYAFNWNYRYLQGTSMASPHVAGVAALIKSIHPDWGPDQIEEALINTAVDLGESGWDEQYGHGLVDAYAALNWSNDGDSETPEYPEIRWVNFYNAIVWNDLSTLAATLKTSAGTWEANSGEYSGCKPVTDPMCDIELYIDGEYSGTFNTCFDIKDSCTKDATLALGLEENGDITFTLSMYCINSCGEKIFKTGNFDTGKKRDHSLCLNS